jgi:hypothetical protein
VAPPVALTGSDDCLLVVAVSDVYQQIAQDHADEALGWSRVTQLGQEAAARLGRSHWLDAWLYREGTWSQPIPLADLFARERTFFLRHFTAQTPKPGFFDLQVVSDELWWIDGPNVHVRDATGKRASWRLPVDRREAANLILLADGTLWHVLGRTVTALRLSDGSIQATPQDAGLPEYCRRHGSIRVARDGRLWMYGVWNSNAAYRWQDGTWRRDQGLGRFTLEDSDGALWFRSGGGEGGGYNIIKGDKRVRLSLAGNFPKGDITLVRPDLLLASGGDRVLALVRAEDGPGWAVHRVLGVKGAFVSGRTWIDEDGNLVGAGWVAKLPESGFP